MVCVARETPPGCEYFHCLGERQMPSQLARIEGALGWSRPCPTPLFWGGGGGSRTAGLQAEWAFFFPSITPRVGSERGHIDFQGLGLSGLGRRGGRALLGFRGNQIWFLVLSQHFCLSISWRNPLPLT